MLALALGGVVVRKTYYALPLRELKRKAAKHDPVAAKIYGAVAYGSSLRSLLWLYIGLTSAASLVLLARTLPIWVSLLIVGPVLWVAFSWLPAAKTSKLGEYLAVRVTPLLTWLLNFLHPFLSRSADGVQKRLSITNHTGIYEREDLLALIEQLQLQHDSRLSDEELEIARRALSFEDFTVGDVFTPRKLIKIVKPDDTVGPVLIDELHKTKQSYALVREKTKSPFEGTIAIKQLDISSKGKVRDLMNPTVYYLHENDKLSQALHAFFVTNQSVFVVVNNFEEYVGIISIENVLKQLLGHVPGDDFDQYANPVAVAARHTKRPEPESLEVSEKAESAEDPVATEEEVIE